MCHDEDDGLQGGWEDDSATILWVRRSRSVLILPNRRWQWWWKVQTNWCWPRDVWEWVNIETINCNTWPSGNTPCVVCTLRRSMMGWVRGISAAFVTRAESHYTPEHSLHVSARDSRTKMLPTADAVNLYTHKSHHWFAIFHSFVAFPWHHQHIKANWIEWRKELGEGREASQPTTSTTIHHRHQPHYHSL